MNWVNMPVSPITGQIALTRILSGPNSTAIDLDKMFTAAFEPLYQVKPGRGRMPATEPTFKITPPPFLRINGTTAWAMLKMDFTLML